MKKTLILAAVLTAASCSLSARENPILKAYPDNITFYVSFDRDTTAADKSVGKPEPSVLYKKVPSFEEKGLFGKAMKSGHIRYNAVQNIDLNVPGTMILWVAPTWEKEKPENGKEPGFTLVYVIGKNKEYTFELIISKMSGQPWGKSTMNNYVQYGSKNPDVKYPHVNCMVKGTDSVTKWPKGEWHMLACTWGDGKFTNSVNGGKSTVSTLKTPLAGTMTTLDFNCEGPIILDEAVILNKVLTDAELAKIYADTMAAVKAQ